MTYPGGPTVAYGYDAAGHRTSETRNGQVTTSTCDDTGQLITVGSKTYSYDADGNLLQAGSDTFAWDHEDRLIQATVGSHTASYTYDGDGNRVGATVDGVPSSYLVDAQGGQPTLVEDGSRAYLHADGLLGEVGGGTRYALSDALGSVRGLADESGGLVGTASYEAFGAPRTSSGASSLFGFTGEPTDATGLVYLRARTLDPATGRFLSADTVIPNAPSTSGYNLYAYAGNDPTTWTDPTGHQVGFGSVDEAMLQAVEAIAEMLGLAGLVITAPDILRAAAAILGTAAAGLLLGARVAFWFAVVAVVLFILLWVVSGVADEPIGADGGETEWTADELEDAQSSPAPPTAPVPATISFRGCRSTKGLDLLSLGTSGVIPVTLYRGGRGEGGMDPGPYEIRPGQDITVTDGSVCPEVRDGDQVAGLSTYDRLDHFRKGDYVWEVARGTLLPEGLAVVADGG